MFLARTLVSLFVLTNPIEAFLKPSFVARPGRLQQSAVSGRKDVQSLRASGSSKVPLSADSDGAGEITVKNIHGENPEVILHPPKVKKGKMEKEREQAEAKAQEFAEAKAALQKGSTPVNMELFCKAGPDGESLGDCPFTHYVNMVAHAKGLDFKVTPLGPNNKPDWLMDMTGGKMPVLVDDGESYSDSSKIVEYLEFFYLVPPLTVKDKPELVNQAMEVCSGVFGALAKCVKNLDRATDPPLVDAVFTELGKVDEHLKAGGGPYLCGEQITLADCSFAPKLYHASTTLAHFKNTIVPPEMEALRAYMDTVFSSEAFTKSSYPPDVVVWGWNNARGTAAK